MEPHDCGEQRAVEKAGLSCNDENQTSLELGGDGLHTGPGQENLLLPTADHEDNRANKAAKGTAGTGGTGHNQNQWNFKKRLQHDGQDLY